MATLLNYPVFFRKHGVRVAEQLLNPPLTGVQAFTLPMNSMYHHIEFDGITIGPMADHLAFAGQIKSVSLLSVMELVGNEGAPRKQPVSQQAMDKQLVGKNRRLRIARNLQSVLSDQNTLVTVNYNYLFHVWKYTRAQFTEVFKWRNAMLTVVQNVQAATEASQRNHFLFAGAAPVMPSVAQLNAADDNITANLLPIFSKPNALLLLELWKWLGPDRSKSIFAPFKRNKLHLINIIFIEAGRWTMVNLGYLDSFRKDPSDQIDTAPGDADMPVIKGGNKQDPIAIQKRMLMMFMRLTEIKSVVANTDSELKLVEEEDEPSKNLDGLSSDVEVEEYKTLEQIEAEEGQPLTEKELEQIRIDEDKTIDESLIQLEEISMRRSLDDDGDAVITTKEIMKAKALGLDESIALACEKLENTGSLSAAEYKRFTKLGDTYKTLPNPFGGGTIEQALVIKPEEQLVHTRILPDAVTVHDKSMLKDTLGDYDERYIEKILPKHMASMTMAVQRAGYCVTEFTAEQKGDIMGEYTAVRLCITPVEGAPSTLHMKLPVVDKFGVMRANDVDYRLKKLRVDCPIRKIAPDRVALTSYYGKTFVYRGRKKAKDYGEWLRAKIMLKGMNEQDKTVTNVYPTSGFDPEFQAPRVYTAISLGFREMTVQGYRCLFDHKEAATVFGPSFQKSIEQGRWPIGIKGESDKTQIAYLDRFGAVSISIGGQSKDIGSMESFLGIPQASAPVDFAEVSILGKDIPVGIILAYYMGLNNLLKALGVVPRRVEAGRRTMLEDNEYGLQFSDETLIFDRQDKHASLILAGFDEFYKACRKYSVYNFDKSAVYLNIFEANGLNARYLREIDLVDKMFVDPITQDLLEQMGEPTNFQGLLIRSCEMLLNDQHKDPLDLSEQRLRGYERIAGAVYTELVRSLRTHAGQAGRSNKKLDMKPFAVWKRIFEDPSKEQVSQINPIQELRHKEAVTFSGEGGRSKDTMNKDSRSFHRNDMGVISENTSDSADVGINTYMSAAPNLDSLAGTTKRLNMEKDGVASLLSTSTLLSPSSDRDD